MGFTFDDRDHRIYKLQRSIYRFKQAFQSWNLHFDEAIKSFDFIKNEEESYVYKRVSGSVIIFLVLYMDDILFIENDIFIPISVKRWLSKKFFMKDLKETSYILGIKVYRDRSERILDLSQKLYIEKY